MVEGVGFRVAAGVNGLAGFGFSIGVDFTAGRERDAGVGIAVASAARVEGFDCAVGLVVALPAKLTLPSA